MVRWLKTASRQSLVLVSLGVLIVPAGVAVAASSGGTPPPPSKLSAEIRALNLAPKAPGMTGRVEFKNNLLGSMPGTSDPMLTGGSGRLWVDDQGRVRAELQSDGGGGDAQVLVDSQGIQLWHAAENTLYQMPWSKQSGKSAKYGAKKQSGKAKNNPRSWLAEIQKTWNLSAPQPGVLAGRPVYNLRATPRQKMGQIGALGISWDAQYKIPLAIKIWAVGADDPVLEIQATEAEFVAPPTDTFQLSVPEGAKKVSLGSEQRSAKKVAKGKKLGLQAASRRAAISLPGVLLGQKFSGAYLGKEGLMISYGQDLNGWVLAVSKKSSQEGSSESADLMQTVDLGNTSGKGLFTALGGFVSWSSGTRSYMLAGSNTETQIVEAAQSLAS